ncbi:MAG TPA: MliC family protein [Gemmatimonadaceae bacterium]|nr:MliC family protein [Gemmatimonadaceae bacterium]
MVIPVLLLALAAACARPPAAPAPLYIFTCSDGYVVKASFGGDTAVVTLPESTLVMHRLVSADGGRYGAGRQVFWEKGSSAFVMSGDSIVHRDCARRDTTS